jgi:LmbE family N-acetylglucosaminyl deacetylase
MIIMNKEMQPDLVLIPSTDDTHQDHQTISQEGFRAFKKTSMIGYEMPYNNLTFRTNMFVSLEKIHIQNKIEALQCYKSQIHKPYSQVDFIEGLARVRGTQIGVQYAEAFEVIRWINR